MPTELRDGDGKLLTFEVSGTLTEAELKDAQARAAALIRRKGKVRVLVLAEHFRGWQRGGEWNDFSFQEEADPAIEKMAIVGDPKIRDAALLFVGQGARPFPIAYFASTELESARAWLAQTP
jgi:hypothetical protein